MYPIVNVLTHQPIKLENPIYTFPYECDPFQLHSFNSIEQGHDILVCAPTASGKTTVIQYALLYNIIKLQKRAVLIVPIKVLANQAYADLKKILQPLNITVGILTGDIKIDETAQCLVLTAEILRNSMYQMDQFSDDDNESKKRITKEVVDSIGCIVVDEAHYANDEDRGQVWEEIMILAKKDVQLVLLSATISKPEKFANWISRCHQNIVDLIMVEKRKVPLKHYFLINNCSTDMLDSTKKLYLIMNENNAYSHDGFMSAKYAHDKWIKERQKKGKMTNNPNNINYVIKWLQDNDKLQALVFCFSRKDCETYAQSINFELVTHEENHKIKDIFDKIMLPHKKTYEASSQYNIIRELLTKGIGFHHAGLFPILKEITEEVFKLGLGKVLFCTETYAAGVNCPAKTVVFIETKKYSKHGRVLLTTDKYKQMAGRAGRRGLDTNGEVIILFKDEFPDESEIRTVLTGEIPEIRSRLKLDYQFYLRTILSNVTNLTEFYTKSLANEENEIIYRGLKTEKLKLENDFNDINAKVSQIVNKTDVNKLIEYEKKMNSEMFGIGIKVSLNKKDQKDYLSLQKKMSDQNFKKSYDLLKKQSELQIALTKNNYQIGYYESMVAIKCSNIKNLLYKWGYTVTCEKDNLIKSDINIKGVIAGNINECNPILLTEVICGNYFDNMTIQEIIGFVSIFGNPIKASLKYESIEMENFNGTPLIRDKIRKFLEMRNSKQTDEDNEFGIGYGVVNWDITTNYIDLAYNWANGASVKEILEQVSEIEEGEGDFVKNMLKIENIISDIKNGCKIIGKIELLPVLEKATELIIRDIVTVTSLHLQ